LIFQRCGPGKWILNKRGIFCKEETFACEYNSPGWSGYDKKISATMRLSFEKKKNKKTERLIEGYEKIKDIICLQQTVTNSPQVFTSSTFLPRYNRGQDVSSVFVSCTRK